MDKRAEEITHWIEDRKKAEETRKCIFYVTVPKIVNLTEDDTIAKVEEMFDRNGIIHGYVDTLAASWNLNRDWVETKEMDCIVEFCGVYPTEWAIEDIVEFERMEHDGEIIVQVYWAEDGKLIPNN